jgi:hypothetical protein
MGSVAQGYREQFHSLVEMLDKQLAELDDATLAKRPNPQLNPPGFIAWHLMRVWDLDLNVLIGGHAPTEDAWHRGGFNAELGYEPLGNGPRGSGLGFGYSDTEVEALPHRGEVLRRYLAQLRDETDAYLAGASDADLAASIERPGSPFGVFTPAARLQHTIAHSWNHTGELRMTKSMLGFDDPSGPRRPQS